MWVSANRIDALPQQLEQNPKELIELGIHFSRLLMTFQGLYNPIFIAVVLSEML